MADSSDEEHFHILQIQAVAVQMHMQRKARKREYMRSVFANRKVHGDYHQLVKELELGDDEFYVRYLRMTPELLEYILRLVGPLIQHQDTHRIPIGAKERLVITLR